MTDLTGKKIAIIATDHFEEAELVTPRDELAKAGAEVKIYSTDTDPIQAVEGDTEPDPEGRRRRHLRRPRRVARSTRSSYPAAPSTPTTSASTRTPRSIVREALDTDKVRRGDLPRPLAAGQRRASRRAAR